MAGCLPFFKKKKKPPTDDKKEPSNNTDDGKAEEAQKQEGVDGGEKQGEAEEGGADEDTQAEPEANESTRQEEGESPQKEDTDKSFVESPAERRPSHSSQSDSPESSGSSVSADEEDSASSSVSDGTTEEESKAEASSSSTERDKHVSDTESEEDHRAEEPDKSSSPSKASDTVQNLRRLSTVSDSVGSSKSLQGRQAPGGVVPDDRQASAEGEGAAESPKVLAASDIAAESKAEQPRSLPKLPSLSRRTSKDPSLAAADLGEAQTREVEPPVGSWTLFSLEPVAVAALPTPGEEEDRGETKNERGMKSGGRGEGEGGSGKRTVAGTNPDSNTADQIAKLQAEKDALSKQLEETAAFYTDHIQKVTEIYNRVVARARAAEKKKNKYAEKLADLMMKSVSAPATASRASEGETRDHNFVAGEVEALRVEKQELEDRIGALVDRCYLLQQELEHAQMSGVTPVSASPSSVPAPSSVALSADEVSGDGMLSPKSLLGPKHRSSSVYGYARLLTERVEKEDERANKGNARGESVYGYPRLLFEQQNSLQKLSTAGSSMGLSRLLFEDPTREDKKEVDQGVQRGSSRVTFVEGGRKSGPDSPANISKKLPSVAEKEAETVDRRRSVYPTELFTEAEASLEDKRRRSSMPGYPRLLFDEQDEGEGTARASGGTSKDRMEFPVAESCASDRGIEQFLKQADDDDDNSILSGLPSRRGGTKDVNFSDVRTSRQFPEGGAPVMVTAQCCGKMVKKADLRNMEKCGCTVCRTCLKKASLAAKEDIRNFMGSDPDRGGPQWRVYCPRCSRPQIVSPTKTRAFSFVP